MTVQDILNLDAKDLAAAAAFNSAMLVYTGLAPREGRMPSGYDLFISVENDDDHSKLRAAIAMLGSYAIDRKAAGPVMVTHAKRCGLIDEDQAEDIYVELALTIFAAHAISAHEAITALQERLRKALAEAEADQGGRVTTMALKDSIFRPVGHSMEMDPERLAALALGARPPLDDDGAAGGPALSLGAPETEPDGAIKLGELDGGDGDGQQENDADNNPPRDDGDGTELDGKELGTDVGSQDRPGTGTHQQGAQGTGQTDHGSHGAGGRNQNSKRASPRPARAKGRNRKNRAQAKS